MYRQDIVEFTNFTLIKNGKTFATDGCAIACVFYLVEQEINKTFTIKNIKSLIKSMYKKGYIDNEFTIQGHWGWEKCFEFLGMPINKITYIKEIDYKCKEDEREILYLKKPGYGHFVPGNGKGCYSWDSLGKRDAQKDYSIAEKRIVRL